MRHLSFHIGGCKISHGNLKNIDNIIDQMSEEYENEFTNGKGKMKVAQGKVHKYLGMTLDFATKSIC